ncbi:uncharacterized protein BHQ10_008111 [Talaromyces amestolkiae]|uniref:Acireductone dioxygenase n=1 Tax=Talaromyces amestolkiae TaxID=1196081 RepID=A0A364L8I5_TALAM|nr:uncharacterized protein BHQ10_008111 [Talaromyces amestolkiae]RAO72099.1 hypothetical protein BHQ10_008111 [Talaromyces amestolkiae]
MKAYWYDNAPVSISSHRIYTKETQSTPQPLYSDPTIQKTAITNQQQQGDQREDHDSGRPVTESQLQSIGVIYHHFPQLSSVDALASERGYKNRDEITVSPEKMGSIYEEKVKSFFSEHLHEDEEIRYILDGDGFFDVRSEGDEWIRIRLEKDDLLILPAGIYHRFTTDAKNYIKAMRLFQDEPKWTPLNRGPDVDVNPHRQSYLKQTAVA